MGSVEQDKCETRNEAEAGGRFPAEPTPGAAEADGPLGTHSVPVCPGKLTSAAAWEAVEPAGPTRRVTTLMEHLTGDTQPMQSAAPEADDGDPMQEDFFAICESIEAAAGKLNGLQTVIREFRPVPEAKDEQQS